MSAVDNLLGKDHLLGDTTVPRSSNPAIRGSIRRADPDGSHSQPFVLGLNGTSLTFNVSPVGALVANFASDDFQTAIDLINTLSPANLYAEDVDGFLNVRNLNGGGTNYIKIVSGTAAALLGFVLDPEPGSVAYAGDIDVSPSGTYYGQANPQGTALLADDEELRASGINRALAASLLQTARVFRELDVELPVVREIDATITVGVGADIFIHITDASIRIPVTGFDISTTDPDEELLSIAAVLLPNGDTIHDLGNATEPMLRVDGIFSHDGTATALDDSVSFAAWGTPDGKSIFGPTVANKDKQAQTAITGIRGNVLEAAAATFVTNGVQPGDTLEIANATNTDPFSHNGEFVVDQVLDETRIKVRPKSIFEGFIGASTARPTALNSSSVGNFGDVRIPVGNFFSAEVGVTFRLAGVPNNITNGTAVKLRVVSGARVRDLDYADVALSMWSSPAGVVEMLRQHVATGIVAAGSGTIQHSADQITAPAVVGSPDSLTIGSVEDQLAELLGHINSLIAGQVAYGGGIDWADTAGDTPAGPTSNPATNLEAQVDKMLTDLAGAGKDGAAKIRALAAGDLDAGNIRAQLNQLDAEWLKLDRGDTVTGSCTFSADQNFDAAVLSFTGLGDTQPQFIDDEPPSGDRNLLWKMRLESGLPSKYTRLYVTPDGWEFTVNAVWGGASWSSDDASEGSTKLVLSATNFDLLSRAAGVGTWIDSAWTSTPLSFGLLSLVLTLASQVDVDGTANLNQQTNLGASLLSSLIDAATSRLTVDTAAAGLGVGAKTLVLETGHADEKWRLYVDRDASQAAVFELTYNAHWADDTGTYKWFRETASNHSIRVKFRASNIYVDYSSSSYGSPWANDSWENRVTVATSNGAITWDGGSSLNPDVGYLDLDGGSSKNPSAATFVNNRLYAKNIVKAWGKIDLDTAAPSLAEGFNISNVAKDQPGSNALDITVYIADNMGNSDYVVVANGAYQNEFTWIPLIVVPRGDVSQGTGGFDLSAYNTSGTQLDIADPSFAGGNIWFIVIGEQS